MHKMKILAIFTFLNQLGMMEYIMVFNLQQT